MAVIPCPHCGPRDVAEFGYVGERGPRPDPNAATPQAWRRYLYQRQNPAGWTDELWFHRAGCRRHLAVRRNTVTGEISSAVLADGSPATNHHHVDGRHERRDVG